MTATSYHRVREARRRAVNRDITLANARPFYIPRCAQCPAPLADAEGNPRWDLIGERFVCLGGCTPQTGATRKAALT